MTSPIVRRHDTPIRPYTSTGAASSHGAQARGVHLPDSAGEFSEHEASFPSSTSGRLGPRRSAPFGDAIDLVTVGRSVSAPFRPEDA